MNVRANGDILLRGQSYLEVSFESLSCRFALVKTHEISIAGWGVIAQLHEYLVMAFINGSFRDGMLSPALHECATMSVVVVKE